MTVPPTTPTPGESAAEGPPKPKRGWFRRWHLRVPAVVILAAFLVYWAGWFPGYNETMDGFWRWFDGSLERLQVMSWLVAAVVAAVTYRSYLADKRSRLIEQARWAVDRATEGRPEQQQIVGKQAITDLQRSAEVSGDQLPGFVDTANTVTDTFKADILTVADSDPGAVAKLRREDQSCEPGTVDGAQEGER